jgi:hypothetical protein
MRVPVGAEEGKAGAEEGKIGVPLATEAKVYLRT